MPWYWWTGMVLDVHVDIPQPGTYLSFFFSPSIWGRGFFFPPFLSHRGTYVAQEQIAINRFQRNRREIVAKLKLEEIDYKRLDVLSKFLTPTGKIEAARRTGASRKQQSRVVRAIKRARFLGLLPYAKDDAR